MVVVVGACLVNSATNSDQEQSSGHLLQTTHRDPSSVPCKQGTDMLSSKVRYEEEGRCLRFVQVVIEEGSRT